MRCTGAPVHTALGPELDADVVGRIHDALVECVLDMQALTSLVADRARGRHPALHHVLGLLSPESRPHVRTHDAGAQLQAIAAMRHELAIIRDAVTDQYAAGKGGGVSSAPY